jgi:hypothetical protein
MHLVLAFLWAMGAAAVFSATVDAADVAGPSIPEPAPRIAGGAWKDSLAAHPRLYGSVQHLKALAAAQPQVWQEVRKGTSLMAVGVTRAVEGADAARIEPFLAQARKHVAAGATNIHQDTHIAMTHVALVYDFFHDAIAPDERKAMVEWLNANFESFTADESAFHNSTLSKIECYLQVAYATWGENPRAAAFRDHAVKKLYEGRVLPVLLEFGAGGGYTECGWYTRGSLWSLVKGLEMARRMDGYDGLAKAPRFFYQRMAYERLQPYPGLGSYREEVYAVEGDGSFVYGGHREYPRHTRTVLAQYWRGSPLARHTAAVERKASNPEARLIDFLYAEPSDEPLPRDAFPLAHAATGIGKVYARSDWSDDATWLRFECGDFWNQHQHFETGNFEIFRREPLATESGEYRDYVSGHSVNWLMRTIAHNCILVNKPDETWSRMRDGGRNPYANDGGQAKKWEWVVHTLPDWQARRAQFERGDIVAYENRPEVIFVAGDCTAAYDASKLRSWVRQIVFVRPTTIVVFDRVIATRPEYEKTWVLHMTSEPKIEASRVAIAAGKGRLTADVLLPEGPVIRAVEGYTYGGQTFNEKPSNLTPLAPKWRIEVLPPQPREEDAFLHVLQTADEPLPVSLLKRGGAVGAKVGDAEVIFTGPVGGSVTAGGKTFDLKPGVVAGPFE